MQKKNDGYKWYILALVVLTNMLVIAMPSMGMSVLAKEISQDLGLSVVQVGVVWGIGSMPAIFTSLLGGGIGDKFGPKRVLVIGSLIAGLLGAARGFVSSYYTMLAVVIILGGLIPFVSMNGVKIVGQWFHSSQLGLANGLISMGMALGFLFGAMLSATFFSPLLGGWRNVLILYGSTGALFCIPWAFVKNQPQTHLKDVQPMSLRAVAWRVVRIKNVWLLGLTLFGIGGCIQSILGYLPLYLRNIGWNPVHADGVLSAFHTASMIFVMPIALWSDRMKSRKGLLLSASILVMVGTALLTIATDYWVWVAVLLVGFVRDGFMAILLTMIIEVDGVGPAYAGTAMGFVMALSGIANTIAPPLGNRLADSFPSAPFILWAAWALFGAICLSLFKQTAPEMQKNIS